MAHDFSRQIRDDYLSGGGFFGRFIYPYHEELKKSAFFLKTMKEFVEKSEGAEVSELKQGLSNLSPAARDEFWQVHYPMHWQEIFSNRIRAAFIMQLCSFLEGEMNEVCARVSVIAESPVKVNDLRGSTLSKPRKFLGAFGKFERPSEENWTIQERIFDVRNVMVHEGGFAGAYRNYKKMVDFAETVPGMSFSNGHVEVRREFCEYCLASVTKFCDELHAAYEAYRESAFTMHKLDVR